MRAILDAPEEAREGPGLKLIGKSRLRRPRLFWFLKVSEDGRVNRPFWILLRVSHFRAREGKKRGPGAQYLCLVHRVVELNSSV